MRRLPAAGTRVVIATLLCAGLLLRFSPAQAAPLARSSFLSLPQSVRQAGEGGIGLGEVGEAGSGGTNPARLVHLEREIALFAGGGVLHGDGARYFLAGAGYRIGETAALGTVLTSAERRFDQITDQGVAEGQELAQSTVTIAAYGAWRLTPQLAAGLGLKLVRDTVDGAASTVPALDAGVQAGWGWLTVGAAVRHLAPAANPESGGVPSDGFPPEARVEAVVRPWPSLGVGADYAAVAQRDGRIAAGCEWAPAFARALVLRAGVDGVSPGDRRPTAGLSLSLRRFALDYAIEWHPVGVTHLAGLRASFDHSRAPDEVSRGETGRGTAGTAPRGGGEPR